MCFVLAVLLMVGALWLNFDALSTFASDLIVQMRGDR
jgi:hypothetical protein